MKVNFLKLNTIINTNTFNNISDTEIRFLNFVYPKINYFQFLKINP